jgi:hypothetical protein
VDKIRHHPDYKSVPADDRKLMTSYCKDVIKKAETLKTELLQTYEREHEEYKVQQIKLRQEEEANKAKAEEEARRNAKLGSSGGSRSTLPSAPPQPGYIITPAVPKNYGPGSSSGGGGAFYQDDSSNVPSLAGLSISDKVRYLANSTDTEGLFITYVT